MRKFKYFAAFIVPILGIITFNTSGVYAFAGLFFLYVFVPVLEQFLPKNTYNLNEVEKDLAKKDVFFDLVLYLSVPLHLFVISQFLIYSCYLKREVTRNPQYLGYLFPTFSKMVRFAPYKQVRNSVQFK